MPTEQHKRLFPEWDDFCEVIRPRLGAVARIDRGSDGTLDSAFATGVLVAPDTLLTNAHVVRDLMETGELSHGVFARFGEEQTPHARRRARPITGLIAQGRLHDIALLRVEAPKGVRPLPLAARGELHERARVAAIGYPSADDQAPEYADTMFDRAYGVERVSPGEVMDQPHAGRASFLHDCTTLRGSSGSAIVALATGELVGLHKTGFYLDHNEAVPVAHIRRLIIAHTRGG